MRRPLLALLALALFVLCSNLSGAPAGPRANPNDARRTAQTAMNNGNFQDAYRQFSALALDAATPGRDLVQPFRAS